ncbi:MAG: glycosyltransferase family 2 protein [Lachnospiraceae bacterium]|nr:glycosyltransferase family 2 protein [Lachnospiraceae bacterium]
MADHTDKILLTIFTPTYNRAALLRRAYESLLRQTRKDFVWLIVDDGSDDDTKEAVESWTSDKSIEIRYHYTENGGKMRAHNRGVELCDTELFLCLDSDDYLTDDAVETIYREFLKAEKDFGAFQDGKIYGREFGGITAHKGRDENTPLYGTEFPKKNPDNEGENGRETGRYSTLYGLYLNGFKGETTLVYKTRYLRRYPFPEIKGEKYVPEDYIYDKIDKDCVLKIVPKVLTVCELVSEGYTDSLKKLKLDNPKGWFLYYEQRAGITPASILKFKYAGYYVIYAKRTKKRLFMKDDPVPPAWTALGFAAALLLKVTGRE